MCRFILLFVMLADTGGVSSAGCDCCTTTQACQGGHNIPTTLTYSTDTGGGGICSEGGDSTATFSLTYDAGLSASFGVPTWQGSTIIDGGFIRYCVLMTCSGDSPDQVNVGTACIFPVGACPTTLGGYFFNPTPVSNWSPFSASDGAGTTITG